MRMHMKNFLLKPVSAKWCLGAFFLFFWAEQSWARCTFFGVVYSKTFTVNVPATLAVPKNTPNGTEVFRSNAVTLSDVPTVNCTGDGWGYYNNRGATAATDPSPIGTTGLGWRYFYNGYALSGFPSASTLTGRSTLNGSTAMLQIVKIGEVVPGTVAGGIIGTVRVGSNNLDQANMSLSNPIRIIEISCQTPSVNAPMGKHRSSEFEAIGSVVGQTAFNIQLTGCSSGIGSISYQLDPVNTTWNAAQGIFNVNAGGATGVGIQITDGNNSPISLRTVKQFLVSPSPGSYSIPLRAAYYQTANTVTAGAANAALQFTIIYQ